MLRDNKKHQLRNSDATNKPTYVLDLKGEIMKFTWEDLIALLKKILGKNQTKIGELFGVDRSTISRLRCGKQKTLKFNLKDYEESFAPNIKDITNEKNFLWEMKQELEQMEFDEIVKELDGKDCKSFVVALVRKANKSARCDISQDNPSAAKQVSKGNAPQHKTKEGSRDDISHEKASGIHKSKKGDTKQPQLPVPMYEYFYSELEGFSLSIEKLLNTNPVDFSAPADSHKNYFIEDSLIFWGSINAERKRKRNGDIDGAIETYQSIINFIDALENYLGFLQANSVNPEAFPHNFYLIIDDDGVVEKANGYRERAMTTFKVANAAVKAEHENVERMRASSIQAGKYSSPSGHEERMKKFKVT